jgi:dolichol-phosphate mannosyltransferase
MSGFQIPPGQTLSIVVPFFNEEDNVDFVLTELVAATPGAEIIAVDDGSSDRTWEIMSRIPGVRAIRLERNQGQSAAMLQGLRLATGSLCACMDGDGQTDPSEFASLLQTMEASGADVVCGVRAKRNDTASRRLASKFANRVRRMILDDGVRDTGCSQKLFRREAVDLLVPFNGLHRYLPAIFKHAGLKIAEVEVRHRHRHAGTSKYTNFDRALRGIYDLIGVSWMLKRKVYPRVAEDVTAGQEPSA